MNILTYKDEYYDCSLVLERESNILMLSLITESEEEPKKNALVKFAETVVEQIRKAISSAIEFIKSIFTGKTATSSIDNYKKQLEENPELAKKTYNVPNVEEELKMNEEYRQKFKKSNNIDSDLEEYRAKRKKFLVGAGAVIGITGAAVLTWAGVKHNKIIKKYNQQYKQIQTDMDAISDSIYSSSVNTNNIMQKLSRKDVLGAAKKEYNDITKESKTANKIYKDAITKQKAIAETYRNDMEDQNIFVKAISVIFGSHKVNKDSKKLNEKVIHARKDNLDNRKYWKDIVKDYDNMKTTDDRFYTNTKRGAMTMTDEGRRLFQNKTDLDSESSKIVNKKKVNSYSMNDIKNINKKFSKY